jgi:hypothetical protein
MRKLMLLVAVFGLAGSLWAADPILGTWKVNVAKSKYALGAKVTPKQQTNVVREAVSNQIEVVVTGMRTDGSAISIKWTAPKEGGVMKFQQGGTEGTSAILTVIDPGDWCITVLQNDRQITTYHVVVGKDGKTAREVMKANDAQGKPYEQIQIYERQ